MKPWAWMMVALAWVAPVAVQADHDIDWDEWFDGEVEVDVRVSRGEGAVYAPGEPVRIELETDEDAYVLVYGIDTDGTVHMLFPRWWKDDGWVERDERVRLHAEDLAWPPDRWGSSGIVYIEAVASPLPFDFAALGLVVDAGVCVWYDRGRPFRISGDPFLAFNDIHRQLFPDWDEAVFAVDYTYFYVGAACVAPRYLGYYHERVYLPPPEPGFAVSVRFGWSWEFGSRYCRPVYVGRFYVPGRHIVYHHVYDHAVYPSCEYWPFVERRTLYTGGGGGGTWSGDRYGAARETARENDGRERVIRDAPPERRRQREGRPDRVRERPAPLFGAQARQVRGGVERPASSRENAARASLGAMLGEKSELRSAEKRPASRSATGPSREAAAPVRERQRAPSARDFGTSAVAVRAERAERSERAGERDSEKRAERAERNERVERPKRVERVERAERFAERTEKAARADEARAEKSERVEKAADRAEKAEKTRQERPPKEGGGRKVREK